MEINQALKQHLRIFQFSENILAVVSSSRGESTSETGRSPGVGLEAPQRTAKQASAATDKRLESQSVSQSVFLRIIKFYLFQVFKERNLLFVDRACNMNSLLIIVLLILTCLSTQG